MNKRSTVPTLVNRERSDRGELVQKAAIASQLTKCSWSLKTDKVTSKVPSQVAALCRYYCWRRRNRRH